MVWLCPLIGALLVLAVYTEPPMAIGEISHRLYYDDDADINSSGDLGWSDD